MTAIKKSTLTLTEAGVSISNSSSFGCQSTPPSSPLILSRLLTPSNATQRLLSTQKSLKVSGESSILGNIKNDGRAENILRGWEPKPKSPEKSKAAFFTPCALPQLASQAYGPLQLSLIVRDIKVNQRKAADIGHSKNTEPISCLLITAICNFHFLG